MKFANLILFATTLSQVSCLRSKGLHKSLHTTVLSQRNRIPRYSSFDYAQLISTRMSHLHCESNIKFHDQVIALEGELTGEDVERLKSQVF